MMVSMESAVLFGLSMTSRQPLDFAPWRSLGHETTPTVFFGFNKKKKNKKEKRFQFETFPLRSIDRSIASKRRPHFLFSSRRRILRSVSMGRSWSFSFCFFFFWTSSSGRLPFFMDSSAVGTWKTKRNTTTNKNLFFFLLQEEVEKEGRGWEVEGW